MPTPPAADKARYARTGAPLVAVIRTNSYRDSLVSVMASDRAVWALAAIIGTSVLDYWGALVGLIRSSTESVLI